MEKKKILCTYCVPLIDNSQYTNNVNLFRASWLMHNISEIINETYDLTFLVVFKSDDPSKKLLTSEECFRSLGIKNFGIKHEYTFHPNITKDIGTYVQVARDYKYSNYDIFIFMSTSTIILNPMCITYIANALEDKNIGISGVRGTYHKATSRYEFNPCISTNLFAVRKDLLCLIGSYDTIKSDMDRYSFEHGEYNISVRVLTYGLKAVVVTPNNELLEWKEWGKNGGILNISPDHVLAIDNSAINHSKRAENNWDELYKLWYSSIDTPFKRAIFN